MIKHSHLRKIQALNSGFILSKESRLKKKSSFQQLVQSRKSIRRFLDKPVEREKILTCLEAARVAPSASNVQPWRFLVIDDPKLLEKLAREAFSGIYYPTKFAAKAPAIIVILARLDIIANRIGKQIQDINFYYIDTGIAGEHIVLQAEELGLGTCWIGWFNPRRTRKFLNIPRKYKIVSLMAMGYYEKKPSRERKRRKLDEIAWFNKIP
jgi:nitroreductase